MQFERKDGLVTKVLSFTKSQLSSFSVHGDLFSLSPVKGLVELKFVYNACEKLSAR